MLIARRLPLARRVRPSWRPLSEIHVMPVHRDMSRSPVTGAVSSRDGVAQQAERRAVARKLRVRLPPPQVGASPNNQSEGKGLGTNNPL